MAIWEKPGAREQKMLEHLRQLTTGFDEYGQPVDRQTRLQAITQYQDIMNRKVALGIEQQRADTESEVERRRVSVEEEKLEIEKRLVEGNLEIGKAEVLVKALEVAIQGGLSKEHLLHAFQAISTGMLPQHEILQLEDKDKK